MLPIFSLKHTTYIDFLNVLKKIISSNFFLCVFVFLWIFPSEMVRLKLNEGLIYVIFICKRLPESYPPQKSILEHYTV